MTADGPERPYGTWPSPISAEMVASAGIDFGHVAVDDGTVYWRERRPEEGGRGVVASENGTDVTGPDVNVRTLVHEYGGGDFAVHDGTVVYARFDDQRLYRQAPGEEPVPVTPEPETDRGLRYADLEVAEGGDAVYAVREDHDAVARADDAADPSGADESGGDADEPVTTLVRVDLTTDDPAEVVASGHDFYAAPRLSPDGDRLAWLTWDHPRMPWDGTELHVADVAADGSLDDARVVMGGPEESVFQPEWRADGTLHAVSDRTGWWNLYRREGGEWVPYREEAAEYGVPQWVFGLSTYAFLDDGRVAALVTRDGEESLELLDADDGSDSGGDGGPDASREVAALPFDTFYPAMLRSDGESLVFFGGGPATPTSLVRWTPGGEPAVLRRASDADVDPAYVSTPEHVTVPTRDGAEAYAYVYPPTNPDAEPPADERPPLVVTAHGGPTSATHPAYDLGVQFFTSRGFAVADVNYRGSTGYGRAFREALYGEWGNHDVEDCIDVARHLADEGRVDGDRMAVKGGSAGGFVVLASLAFHDAFDAGASYFGVADLARLAELTHKFESRYLDQLVGPYPEAADTYEARSPVHHAGDVAAPVLVLQGAEDQVVPLSQAEEMVEALEDSGVPHDLVVFEDEQHGFRSAEARERALETELSFYGTVFGFDPADEVPAVDLAVEE